MDEWQDTYRWLLSWAIAIVLLVLASRTKIGYILIYYWLVSLIVFLLVTQYKFIIEALKPLGEKVPGGESSE